MNIQEIAAPDSFVAGRKTAFGGNSFLQLGSKGQTIEGTVTNVSDRVSINFNGVEVAFPPSSVPNAREGEVRTYKIMDVSQENIVLKEVGGKNTSGTVRALMGTSVSAASYSYSEYLEDTAGLSREKQQAGQNIAVLTGEDYQDIEEEQGALEAYKESALDRAIEKSKEHRQWRQESMEAYQQATHENRETVQKFQLQGVIEHRSADQITAALEQADIPVTEANIAQVSGALEQASVIQELSDSVKCYLIGNGLQPTIENIYQGQHSGEDSVTADQVDGGLWQQLLPQVNRLLSQMGADMEQGQEQAKWLFANDLPITQESFEMLQLLDDVGQYADTDLILGQILDSMRLGRSAYEANLDTSRIVLAGDIIRGFSRVTDQELQRAVSEAEAAGTEITLQLIKEVKQHFAMKEDSGQDEIADGGRENPRQDEAFRKQNSITEQEKQQFIAKRQLEEIRLKLTLESAVKMENKGIDIPVTPLKNLVEELRKLEQEYYQKVYDTADVEDTQWKLMQETMSKAEDICRAPAGILGISVRQQSLLTMNVLHRSAVSATIQMQQYRQDYEAVGTQVRKDLGDSIQKAFASVPDLLEEMGEELTEANQRAVRILGYNGMDVTKENLTMVKLQDARVQSVLDNMKPSVVLELIRRGDNPLNVEMETLDRKLRQIAEEQDVGKEEKYSRFLWRLEQDGEISGEEREGYIGIYRLLHQIEKTDGAAVGSVLETGQDMTLGNLLTAVRTMKNPGIDARVDDEFGGLTELTYTTKNITSQIMSGFGGDTGNQRNASGEGEASGYQSPESGAENAGNVPQEQVEYYSRMAEQTLDGVTPALLQQISDGDMEKLLNMSLENLKEQMEKQSGKPELEKALYDKLAQELRDTVESQSEAVRYLEQIQLEDTLVNVQAVERILSGGFDLQKEIYKKKDLLSEEEKQAYLEEMESLPEALDSEKEMEMACSRLEERMEQILDRAYEQPKVTSLNLEELKQISQGMVLRSQLVRRHCYDIPMQMEDGVVTMNVTLVQGASESGKVCIELSVPVRSETEARISMEFRTQKNGVKGLILCDDRETYQSLQQDKKVLEEKLEEKDFNIKNISYGMDYRSREQALADNTQQEVPTARLYQLAKTMVQYTIRTLREKV